MATQLPAVVTIQDLPAGTTLTGTELFEVVQTTGGAAQSVQISASQIMTTGLGALPGGGATGQILGKSSGANFAANWSSITSFVSASTGLAQSGSTAVALSLASTAGLSVLGVGGTSSAVPAAITGTADQVLVVNHGATGVVFGPVNLATNAAVTGVLPGANMSAANLAAPGAGGVQGILPVPNGGTNTSTLTAFGVLYGNGTSAVGVTAAGSAGQIIVGQTVTSAPSWQTVGGDLTLTAGGAATVAAFAITAGKIATGAVGSTQLGANAVQRSNITAAAIGSAQVDTAAILRANITAAAIGSAQIDTGAVLRANLTAVAVGSAQIDVNAVQTTNIQQAAGLSILAVQSSGTANFSVVTGAANQFPVVNPAATTIVFSSISPFIDSAIGSSQGAILYRNAASWVILPAGSTGQLLQTGGAANNPQWVGGMVLLNTLSLNNVATAGDTTSLTSTYRNYMVTFENVVPATTATLQLQVATSGTAFISGGYISQAQVNIGSTIITDLSSTVILLSGTRATAQIGSTTTYGINGFMKVFNPANATFRKMWVGDLTFLPPGASTTTLFSQTQVAGYYDGAVNAITGLQFSMNTGNIATGTIRIYGLF